MAEWQMKLIAAEADRLIELAAEDAGLRGDLRALAQKILAATAKPQNDDHADLENPAFDAAPVSAVQEEMPAAPVIPAGTGRASGTHGSTGPAGRTPLPPWVPLAMPVSSSARLAPAEPVAHAAEPAAPVSPAPEPLRELTLGREPPTERMIRSSTATMIAPENQIDHIAQIEAHCRRKAEAARWAAECQRRLRQGYDFEVQEVHSDPEIAEWADRLTDGFYWSNASNASRPADLSLLDDLGGCFEAVAEALSVIRGVADNPKVSEHVLPVIAEAQSALRAGIRGVGAADDTDQGQVFDWLKTTAAGHRIYIKRFMRADDPADPTRWPDLLTRIEKLAERHGPTGRRSQHESLINGLRLRLDVLRGSGSAEADWRAVIEAVEDIVSEGVPPSNRAIRELLLPMINELPDIEDMPPGFRLVLREIDGFVATRASTAESPVPHEPAAEVKEVARLLGGRSVVLIGGSRRRGAQESLERAFALKDLIWIETKEHQAVAAFEPLIARRDVALVLLAIRWSSHAFRDVKPICDRHAAPLARLPGGYNPNQVAAQILSQCSGQLVERI